METKTCNACGCTFIPRRQRNSGRGREVQVSGQSGPYATDTGKRPEGNAYISCTQNLRFRRVDTDDRALLPVAELSHAGYSGASSDLDDHGPFRRPPPCSEPG